MNIEKLKDNRNDDLYREVRERYKVNLKRSSKDTWNSYIENDVVIIGHSPTKYPISAFTHELLHIDTQLNGFKKMYRGISQDKETHKQLPIICRCLDNELQHHKMYDKYISLGFSSEEFYNDSDTETVKYLQGVLATPQKSLLSLSVDYMTLIAPGGVIPEQEKGRTKK